MNVAQNLYESLLDIARGSVRKLDLHPMGGMLVAGTLPRDLYLEYLAQVAHQVRGSGPMLEQAGQRLHHMGRQRLAALFLTKAGEEDGHDAWALADLNALGVSHEAAVSAPCCGPVQAYQAWTSYLVEVVPVAVLGLAFVLEWLGYARAGRAASNLVAQRRIPDIGMAVRFLRGHGEADQQHIQSLANALEDITDPDEAEAILLSARVTSALQLGLFDWAARRHAASDGPHGGPINVLGLHERAVAYG